MGELLALPPEEFTAARNAAVKRLRAEGQRDVAETIQGLPRPPLSLWALNHVAHEQPKLIEAFLDSAEQLREAYRSGGDIRAATSPERDAEAAVVGAAVEFARGEGRKLTEAVMERLRQTVRAAAADAGVGEELRNGRLIREPEAPSIGELLGSMPATSAAEQEARVATRPRRGAACAARGDRRCRVGCVGEAWTRRVQPQKPPGRRSANGSAARSSPRRRSCAATRPSSTSRSSGSSSESADGRQRSVFAGRGTDDHERDPATTVVLLNRTRATTHAGPLPSCPTKPMRRKIPTRVRSRSTSPTSATRPRTNPRWRNHEPDRATRSPPGRQAAVPRAGATVSGNRRRPPSDCRPR